MYKVINSRVCPMHFNDGRNQGFSGYTSNMRLEIFNYNALHVFRAQGSYLPILEIEGIFISITGTKCV